MTISKPLQMAVALAVIAAAVWAFWFLPSKPGEAENASRATVDVVLPARLSVREQQGKALYDENCGSCHGVDAAGSDIGPPLIHQIYEPSHHSDAAFVLAAERGVRAHHWRFGDMPAQERIGRAEVGVIVSYVRALQETNGIR